jgi:ferric-dicitrate binding protein FerR (iron transport regulator)
MSISKNEDIQKIVHYIEGQASPEEREWVEALFVKGEENSTLRHMLEKDWNAHVRDNAQSDVDLTHLLDRVHHIIQKNEYRKKNAVTSRITRVYMRIAAILLIPLMVGAGLVYRFVLQEPEVKPEQLVTSSIYAPMGARVSFNLPDGSTGMLNSGSRLTYTEPFNSLRQVQLEGEAWFDVTRDEHHPFEISTGQSKVKVLGTSFNVMAYPAENYIEIVLKEGKVDFLDADGNRISTVNKSERMIYRGGEISKCVTDPSKYIAWTKGRMIFNNDPMAEVARRIERWYNVKIQLADKELEKYSFRGTFEDDSLEEVMRFLAMTSPIRYKITPRKMLADGTYEKEKVTIYLKRSKQ